MNTNYRIKQVNATGWSNGTATNVLADGTSFTTKNESQESSYSLLQKGGGSFTFTVDSFSIVKVSANGSLGNNNGSQNNFTSSTNEKDIQVNNTSQPPKATATIKLLAVTSATCENSEKRAEHFLLTCSRNTKTPWGMRIIYTFY